MLLTLFLWTILLLACTATGSAVWRLLGEPLPEADPEERWLALVWPGLVTLASVLLVVSFFTPLTVWVEIGRAHV